MNSPTLLKLRQWLDAYGLLAFTGFLLAFIPLYPKIPFFSPIEQYNVRVRIEDFLVVAAGLLWVKQWWQKKASIQPIATGLILSYAVVGLLSVISAVFIIKTVPIMPLHLGKTVLHYLRYLEYFSLFFVAYSSVTTKKQVRYLLGIVVATVLALAIYGYGQKTLYWPVYSTMNREFSKGVRLYLTEHARVQSTFAGHYDLAAYLVVFLPIVLALAFELKSKSLKVVLHTIHWMGVWLLVVTASRTSFAAYLVAVALVLVLHGLRQQSWLQRFIWTSTRSLAIGLLVTITMLAWGQSMYDRFLQVLEGYPMLYTSYTQILKTDEKFLAAFGSTFSKLPSFGFSASKPSDGISTEEAERIIISSDQRPVRTKPSDVYVDVPDLVEVEIATISASGSATTTTIIEERERVFSECSKEKGLSLCIRLETLWPQAVAGFMRNPLFGSGYATLNKEEITDFKEADSTDNNFLRTLGETGILGVLTFYSLILFGLAVAVYGYRSKDSYLQMLSLGYIAGSIGLLINAVYIDVYASSKVAYSYWMLTGILLAYASLDRSLAITPTIQPTKKIKRKTKNS